MFVHTHDQRDSAMAVAPCANCAFFFEPEPPLNPSTISSDILETNCPPSEFSMPSIREFIARGSARRTRLDAKIASLEALLDVLLHERSPLDADIRKHEGAVSPLRRMPTELLSLIFKYTLPHDLSGTWTIPAVCSRWRTIALSQPTLWSTVVLDFSDDPHPVRVTASKLEAHLERSGEIPLNITFITWDSRQCTGHECKMIDILASHCERWKTVVISGPEALYSRLANIRRRLPLLRELQISVYPNIWEDEYDPIDIFEFCPALQEASINLDIYGAPCITAPLPFSQLLRFGGKNSWTRHLSALRFASNLVDCVLSCIEPISLPSGNTVTLPHLRLSLSTTIVLDWLDTPALQELYCCDQSNPLHSFLHRLRSQLQKLFVPETIFVRDIARLLHAAPTITNLGIYLPLKFTPALFSALAVPTPTDPANGIPALEAISIRVVSGTLDYDSDYNSDYDDVSPHLNEDLLMQMVEAQWQHGTWRSVKLFCPAFTPSSNTLERMELLRSQGMQIVIFPRAHLPRFRPPGFSS